MGLILLAETIPNTIFLIVNVKGFHVDSFRISLRAEIDNYEIYVFNPLDVVGDGNHQLWQ